jgi:hypothetical protein
MQKKTTFFPTENNKIMKKRDIAVGNRVFSTRRCVA